MTDSAYRVIFADVSTDDTIDVLPVDDVEFDDYIGKPGSLTGTIPIPDADLGTRAARLVEGRTAVYLARGNDLWWGGLLWTLTPQCDDKGVITCAIQAATFDSYAAHRYIRSNLAYNAVDSLQVVRNLWQYVQSAPNGNIKLSYGAETSGVAISPSWRDGDETLVDDAIKQLATAAPGFEYCVSVYRDPNSGSRVRLLRLGSPTLTTGTTPLVVDKPGTVLTYAFPRDATRAATATRARGGSVPATDGSGNDVPLVSSVHYGTIVPGFLELDGSADYNDVIDQPTLENLAAANLVAAGTSVVVPSLTVQLDGSFGPQLLGASVRVRINDHWFQPPLDQIYRIVGFHVSPAQRGRPDTVDLFLDGASDA
jgi:hypothetical protein